MDHHVKQAPVQGVTGLWGGTQGALTSGGAEDPVYVEDVYSNFLYDLSYSGNNAPTVTVNNGLDLSGEGGLTITKLRDSSSNWSVFDTARGNSKMLLLNTDDIEENIVSSRNAAFTFQSTGFQITTTTNEGFNSGNESGDHVSTSFKKASGFFDVVTYTGNGSSQNISHSLDAAVGMIWIKKRDNDGGGDKDWFVWHNNLSNKYAGYLSLNNTDGEGNSSTIWNQVLPTTTQFSVGNFGGTNYSGSEYVAYVFANDSTIYGEDADQSVIKTGQYVGNGSSNGPEIDLGWEPQWVMLKKRTSNSGLWMMADSMRGVFLGSDDPYLQANATNAEYTSYDWIEFQSTGFRLTQTGQSLNTNGQTYVYLAIRRNDGFVGKPATAGTDLLAFDTGNNSSTIPCFDSGFPVDFAFRRDPDSTTNSLFGARLYGPKEGRINGNDSFSTENDFVWDSNTGIFSNWNEDQRAWMWRRSNSFDCVAYRGNGSEHHNIPHKMNNTPQMLWIKRTDSSANWHVFHIGVNDGSAPQDRSLNLNNNTAFTTNAAFNNYLPNAQQFKVGLLNDTNANNGTFLAVLFGSVTGLSSVGSYDGNSSSQTITTGFQPRLLLVKKEDGSGSWFLFDTARGWGSGNDNYLQIDETIAQNGSYNLCNPISTGFSFSNIATPASGGNLNESGSHYIYYAHA